ncbi:MAG: nitrilase-related carbon-nitrogen hydrolase, partial [Myxococcota bacterium]|nr:nitrilase-related carbon-nitrogen hydrolase [Myxococcota bacterium]
MLSHRPRVAVVQLCSTPEREQNLERSEKLVRDAARQGAELICLPENTPWMGPDKARDEFCEGADGPSLHLFRSLASSLDVNILLGSYAERVPLQPRSANTSALIGRDGQVLASYRKLHLFDVTTPSGESLRESDAVFAGDAPVCAALGPWNLGLSICYDLRFPELYRRLVDAGATALCVPAAFTAETGRDH